jgi:peptide/nickel transport system substrate-binding protein
VVLIGTSRYDTLAGLPSVEENLMALAEALCAGRVWGLPEQHVAIVADPSVPADMLDPVVRAADEATDTMVLYYAGHGLIDPRGELHLALVGSDPQRSYTAVRYDHIRDALLASRAARRIVILDCCYSGRALGMMADPVSAAVDEAAAEGRTPHSPPSSSPSCAPGSPDAALCWIWTPFIATSGRPCAPRHGRNRRNGTVTPPASSP